MGGDFHSWFPFQTMGSANPHEEDRVCAFISVASCNLHCNKIVMSSTFDRCNYLAVLFEDNHNISANSELGTQHI